jgi:hypothetical protein
MDTKTKLLLVAGGVVFVVVLGGLRSGSKGGSDNTALIQANTEWNRAATQLRMVQAQTAADVVMNRDSVTGATNIQAMRTVENILRNNGQVSLGLTESYNGIVQARIYDGTARYIEAQRASVSKKIAKYGYKSSSHSANMNFASDMVGTTLKAIPSIAKLFG